jgi:hypothetical protein
MVEDGAWMKERVEVKNVVVGGHRPHGVLHFIDDERQPREVSRGADQSRT